VWQAIRHQPVDAGAAQAAVLIVRLGALKAVLDDASGT
jgi:hypothetical protein